MIVVWKITERCNLACKFCGYDRDLSRPRLEADPAMVSAFGAILAEYQLQTGDPVLVSWLGGEPLLWRPLSELTRTYCTEYHLSVSTTTNGTSLASPVMRAHLLEYYSELTVSIDAMGRLHDCLRGWPGGYAALQQNVTALAQEKQAANRGPVLRANLLLMRETLSCFEPLCRELASWGVEEVTFNQLGGNDRPEFYPDHRLSSLQADWLARELPGLQSRLARVGMRVHGGEEYLKRICATARGHRIPVADCKPGQHFLFIGERGLMAPCSFTTGGYGVPLEEINSVDALTQLPERYSRARQKRRLPSCADCHSTQLFEKFAKYTYAS